MYMHISDHCGRVGLIYTDLVKAFNAISYHAFSYKNIKYYLW